MTEEGKQETSEDLKAFGYGSPLFLDYEVGGERKKAVLETMAPSSFGHDHFSDRAQAILWEHSAFNNLPRHVRSLDSGAFLESGAIISTGRAREFFLLTEFVQGKGYFKDLDRIKDVRHGHGRGLETGPGALGLPRRDPLAQARFARPLYPEGSAISSATANASWD